MLENITVIHLFLNVNRINFKSSLAHSFLPCIPPTCISSFEFNYIYSYESSYGRNHNINKHSYTPCVSEKNTPFDWRKKRSDKILELPESTAKYLIFNVNACILHWKRVHQTPEIQAHKVKIWRGTSARGFREGLNHDLI